MLADLRGSREREADLSEGVGRLRDELDAALRRVKELEARVRLMEKAPVVLDGVDEALLWRGATIKLRPRFGGGRQVTISLRGRPRVVVHGTDDDLLLGRAVGEACGRQRPRDSKTKQAQA